MSAPLLSRFLPIRPPNFHRQVVASPNPLITWQGYTIRGPRGTAVEEDGAE